MKITVFIVGVFLFGTAIATADLDPGEGPPRPAGRLDATESQLNISDISIESDEVDDFVRGSQLAKEEGCFPTNLCKLAGGFCVKKRKQCNKYGGTFHPRGCTGKGCKCCVLKDITPTPPTCPACPTHEEEITPILRTCTPCPNTCTTNEGTTNEGTKNEGTTNEGTTNEGTTNEGTTNEGLTLPPDVPWHEVGSDMFVRFPLEMNWYGARALCQSYALDLYHPINIVAIAEYLDKNFNEFYYWLGAKGNGTDQVWFDGEVLTSADPWHAVSYWQDNGNNSCLAFMTFKDTWKGRTVLFAGPNTCTGRTDISLICG